MFGIFVRIGGVDMRAAARRNRREEKRKVILFFALTLCLVFFIGLTFGSFLSKAKENVNNDTTCKYYANIEIQPGDTLWELADEYMDENYDSKDAYIKEVLAINSLASENHIVSGQYLVMPYFAEQI